MNQEELGHLLARCEALAIESKQITLLCKTRIFQTNHYIQINDLQRAINIGLDAKKLAKDNHLEDRRIIGCCFQVIIAFCSDVLLATKLS